MPSTASTETEEKEYIFDMMGDLWLEIGESRTPCLVSSTAMAEASPVFRGMLLRGFSESKPLEGDWVVQLPEDDIDGFQIILSIIHDQWDDVPADFPELETLGFQQEDFKEALRLVYKVARVADKYDLVYILRPVAESWLRAPASGRFVPDKVDGSSAATLWIGWVFGDETLINWELRSVYLSAFVDENAGGDEHHAEKHEKARKDDGKEDCDHQDCRPRHIPSDHEGGMPACKEKTDLLPLWTSRLFGHTSPDDAYDILGLLDVTGMFPQGTCIGRSH